MTAHLPPRPHLGVLRKQAKQLLGAHRAGMPQCCVFLRRLRRFANATDHVILSGDVTLAQAQLAIALHYGFPSWSALKEDVESRPDGGTTSLAAVHARAEEPIPEYAGAGVPLAVVAALNHAGVDMGFMEFAAASGWAFSFGYRYDAVSAAYMAVRGDPDADGPLEVFAFLPRLLGFDYETALTSDPDALWHFARDRVDAGTPVMSEHMDGGLISAYRESGGTRQLFFDGTVATGWIDVDGFHPHAVYSLVRRGDATPPDRIRELALGRAVDKGRAHSWRGTPQGQAALESYLADVRDQSKDFADVTEWFCWAAFERLSARRCCEVWLRRVAQDLDGEARAGTLQAADQYGSAFACYERFGREVAAGEPSRLQERARAAGRIALVASILEEGIAAEAAGLTALEGVIA